MKSKPLKVKSRERIAILRIDPDRKQEHVVKVQEDAACPEDWFVWKWEGIDRGRKDVVRKQQGYAGLRIKNP